MPFGPVIVENRSHAVSIFCERFRVTWKKSIFSEISKICFGEVGQGSYQNFSLMGLEGHRVMKAKN